MRPKPHLWLRLPHTVGDARSLGDYLREYADACTGAPTDSPQRMLRDAARLLEGCAPQDTECMRAVVAALDARAAAAADDPPSDERRYWESVAHAVDRVADAVAVPDAWRTRREAPPGEERLAKG